MTDQLKAQQKEKEAEAKRLKDQQKLPEQAISISQQKAQETDERLKLESLLSQEKAKEANEKAMIDKLKAQQKIQEDEIEKLKTQGQARRKVAIASFRMKVASFQPNVANPLPVSDKAEIKQIAQKIKELPDYKKITVEGHTDSVGTEEANIELSQDRAAGVYNELIKNGIPADKIQVIGFGTKMPIADNKTAKGKALNRRVEIFVE
jgi:outer membrane protein OmpA-like peptidoglycan-associated protein